MSSASTLSKMLIGLTLLSYLCSCGSSDVKDAIDLIDGLPRKAIDTSRTGLNAFVNDQRFGTISAQFIEVRDTLRLNFVRVLFAWNDQIQPSKDSPPNFSFYDEIVANIPEGVDALIVLTGVPAWVHDSANWVGGSVRATFVEQWVRTVTRRYASNRRIIGFQIWNEPNDKDNPDNVLLGFTTTVEAYVEMVASAFIVVRSEAPTALVLNGATTAINQDYPDTLNYNRAMRKAGIESYIDIFAIHYYGTNYENVIRPDGVADFLNHFNFPVWVTESGERGVNSQHAYVERTWPFLSEEISNIERFYYYQFTDSDPAEITFGLRTLDPAFPISDLYVYLRDRS